MITDSHNKCTVFLNNFYRVEIEIQLNLKSLNWCSEKRERQESTEKKRIAKKFRKIQKQEKELEKIGNPNSSKRPKMIDTEIDRGNDRKRQSANREKKENRREETGNAGEGKNRKK